jgi:hypothetical protein
VRQFYGGMLLLSTAVVYLNEMHFVSKVFDILRASGASIFER